MTENTPLQSVVDQLRAHVRSVVAEGGRPQVLEPSGGASVLSGAAPLPWPCGSQSVPSV